VKLDASSIADPRLSGLIMHVNKVHHVTTILVWPRNSVKTKTGCEDGVIWVYGVGEDGVMAFTDFGIEHLIELVKMHKDDTTLLRHETGQSRQLAAFAGCLSLSR
jgi:hypothetical protein